ncbi:hypothetical protein DUNSADRAFT_15261 [Dunaliella salina]|uniref:Encoded protein n=1 Tax=Dunaliella salina TaxID=3046 RepID=A0ABQ7H235_DUNSA|nr:hypothetical protein DUNSADRAFT_15261 [Dunaliella salina]|eukprot:KAF5840893.1 hypothetical protein DUNSADRAFT_15261 [Dunaliella salina]
MELLGVSSSQRWRGGTASCLRQGQPGLKEVKEEIKEEHQDAMVQDSSKGCKAGQSVKDEAPGAEQAENAEATTPLHAENSQALLQAAGR